MIHQEPLPLRTGFFIMDQDHNKWSIGLVSLLSAPGWSSQKLILKLVVCPGIFLCPRPTSCLPNTDGNSSQNVLAYHFQKFVQIHAGFIVRVLQQAKSTSLPRYIALLDFYAHGFPLHHFQSISFEHLHGSSLYCLARLTTGNPGMILPP